jgi:DNA-damage-inducible protein D
MPDDNSTAYTSPFDAIRKADEQGREYWSARDLGKLLGYTTNYRNFQKAIDKAKIACESSGQAASDHFAQVRKPIKG